MRPWDPRQGSIRPSGLAIGDQLPRWSTFDEHTRVSSGRRPSALDVINQIFLVLQGCGYNPTIANARENLHVVELYPSDPNKPASGHIWDWWSPWRPTVIHIGTVAIGLSFYEIREEARARKVKDKWIPVEDAEPDPLVKRRGRAISQEETRTMPCGRFGLRAYSPYGGTSWEHRWAEPRRGAWTTELPSIIRTLEIASPSIAEMVEKAWKKQEEDQLRREEAHREWLRQDALRRQEEARLEAIRRRNQAIIDSRNDLLAIVEEWARARRIEDFFEDIAHQVTISGQPSDDEGEERDAQAKLEDRLRRARELLGTTDALERFREWKTPESR